MTQVGGVRGRAGSGGMKVDFVPSEMPLSFPHLHFLSLFSSPSPFNWSGVKFKISSCCIVLNFNLADEKTLFPRHKYDAGKEWRNNNVEECVMRQLKGVAAHVASAT